MLLVVAALIAAVVSFAPQLGSTLSRDVQCVIAKVFGGGCTPGKASVAAAQRIASQNAVGSVTFSGALSLRALGTFVGQDNILGLVSRAQPGPNRALHAEILDAQKALNQLKRFILRVNLPGGVRRGAGIPDRFLEKTIRQIEAECP